MSDSRPRYRSIFWPLVLIAVGVLWLLGNFNIISGANLFALLRLWPLLLIALGLDILVGRRWPLASALIALVTVGLGVAAVVFAPQLGLTRGDERWWFGPAAFGPGVRGSGNIVTQTREVSDFDAVRFAGVGELTIRPGETESLVIEGDDNLLDLITTEVRDGALTIGLRDEGPFNLIATRAIRYTLTVKTLNRIAHSGAGNIEAAGLTGERLDVTLSGAGNLDLRDLDFDQLSYTLSGAGRVEASGRTGRQAVTLSGFGGYEAEDLESQAAEVRVSGAGSATVWARESLDVRISGAGSVEYYGSPSVRESISGLGSVRHRGDK